MIGERNAVNEITTTIATTIKPTGELATVLLPAFPSGLVLVVVADAGVAGEVELLKIAASGEFAGNPRSSAQNNNKKKGNYLRK